MSSGLCLQTFTSSAPWAPSQRPDSDQASSLSATGSRSNRGMTAITSSKLSTEDSKPIRTTEYSSPLRTLGSVSTRGQVRHGQAWPRVAGTTASSRKSSTATDLTSVPRRSMEMNATSSAASCPGRDSRSRRLAAQWAGKAARHALVTALPPPGHGRRRHPAQH